MIAYEIQLWYVIRDKIQDKIQSEIKLSPRKIRENFFLSKNFVRKKLSWTLSQISSAQNELS